MNMSENKEMKGTVAQEQRDPVREGTVQNPSVGAASSSPPKGDGGPRKKGPRSASRNRGKGEVANKSSPAGARGRGGKKWQKNNPGQEMKYSEEEEKQLPALNPHKKNQRPEKKSKFSKTATRTNKFNKKIAESIQDAKHQSSAEKDALHDKIDELKDKLEDKQPDKAAEFEVEVRQYDKDFMGAFTGNYETIINNIISKDIETLKVRPACNVGRRISPILLGGRNVTLPVFVLFLGLYTLMLFLMLIFFTMALNLPSLIVAIPIMISQIIGYVITTYLFWKFVCILVVGRKTYQKIYSEVSFDNSYLAAGAIDSFGNVVDLRPSDIKIGDANHTQVIGKATLKGPLRVSPVSEELLNFNEPVITAEPKRSMLFFRTVEVEGGEAFVDRYGQIRPSVNLVFGFLKVLFSNKPTTYMVGSYTAKEFMKPEKDRKMDNFAYAVKDSKLLYDAHTFHNACTYSANSSQVSEETNFSILYRKISRYTEINISRYGLKDLQTNAEILCRMQYFAIREANPNYICRQHF